RLRDHGSNTSRFDDLGEAHEGAQQFFHHDCRDVRGIAEIEDEGDAGFADIELLELAPELLVDELEEARPLFEVANAFGQGCVGVAGLEVGIEAAVAGIEALEPGGWPLVLGVVFEQDGWRALETESHLAL